MELPGRDELKRLLAWRPDGGVLSVYVAIDPADRSEGWRTELKERLREVSAEQHAKQRSQLRDTIDHVLERFAQDAPLPEGRGQVGFVQVAGRKRDEEWYSSQWPPRRVEVSYGRRPYLRPLVELLDEGGRYGVVAISAELVHLYEWENGEATQVEGWELEMTSLDWRERKAQRSADPARVHGAKAAGRDQFAQRLEANRDRFLAQVGGLADQALTKRGWQELLVFGDEDHWRRFESGLHSAPARHVETVNVIHEGAGQIERRLDALIPELNRSRELRLVEKVKSSAYRGKERVSLGPQETLEVLAQGRVEHLVFDAERDYRGEGIEEGLLYEESRPDADGLPLTEILIERAIQTDARVTPVEGEAAAALGEHGGVAAVLRY